VFYQRTRLTAGSTRHHSPRHQQEEQMPLAMAGTGYGLIGILVIILLVVLIFYFVRRA
jgi:hypothetical protein